MNFNFFIFHVRFRAGVFNPRSTLPLFEFREHVLSIAGNLFFFVKDFLVPTII